MHHSIKRVYQRTNIKNELNARSFIKNARVYGKDIEYYRFLPSFYSFLCAKKEATGKKVRVYKGYIFILNSSKNCCSGRISTGCTTMYAVPLRFRSEVERYESERTVKKCEFKLLWPTFLYGIVDLEHSVKQSFAKFLSDNGVNDKYCLKGEGTSGRIQHNFKDCGYWKIFDMEK